jgi:hypothetical protein
MDIECPTCGEPWDTYHLRHDEPLEWSGLSAQELQDFLETGRFSGVKEDRILAAAQACGWEFATESVLSFVKCPCCSRRSVLGDATQRRNAVQRLASVLDGDDDALASELAR